MFSLVLAEETTTTTSSGGGILGLLPLILIFVVMYFLLLRPQRKRQKEALSLGGDCRRRASAGDEGFSRKPGQHGRQPDRGTEAREEVEEGRQTVGRRQGQEVVAAPLCRCSRTFHPLHESQIARLVDRHRRRSGGGHRHDARHRQLAVARSRPAGRCFGHAAA
ncbi:MAG: preprotein translocase subunit YajC [Actinobacteria bacterium]|nr:preprotein translocase subunit YajC [Actinomycetota bacterium]